MVTLPPPSVLAGLVTNVTNTMLGLSFAPDDNPADPARLIGASRCCRSPALSRSRSGSRPIRVAAPRSPPACSRQPAAVDASMAEDALRELVNMTAGLVKSTLGLDQVLGLPKIYCDGKAPLPMSPDAGTLVVLKATGLGLVLWICDGVLA